MKQLHAELVTLGFTGSYARVAAFARQWKADRQREQQTTGRGTFVPLYSDPGLSEGLNQVYGRFLTVACGVRDEQFPPD